MRIFENIRTGIGPNIKKAATGIILSISFSFFAACSSEDSQGPQDTGGTEPYSAVIGNSNKNMPSGGIITSQYSDAEKDVNIKKIVDNDPSTKYVTNHSEFYILWESNQGYAVNQYSLVSAADAPERDPRAWTLFGSKDGHNWVELDKATKQTFSERNQEKVFELENQTEYKYYKLSIEQNNGDAYTQIAEYSLKEVVDPKVPYTVTLNDSNQNMPSRGELTSQYGDFPKGSDIGKIADNDLNTKFVTYHSEFYILWAGNTAAAVNYYTIVSAYDTPEGDPKSWTLSGSSDNRTWTELDNRSGETFSKRKEEKRYMFENEVAYKYFRIDFKENNGGSCTQIAELTLKEVLTDAENLMKKVSTINDVSKSPMGSVHYGRPQTTDEIREWLLNPDNEPSTMIEGWEYHSFPVTLYPYSDPLPADVNQRSIGDCSGLSALASLAYSYPKFIKSIITDNGNNTYTVKMFDPAGARIEVGLTNKFLSGDKGSSIAAATGKKSEATWGTLLEKAVLKWKAKYDPNNQDLGGISSQYVMPLFTGNGYFFNFWQNLTCSELAQAVRIFLTEGYLITGGFSRSGVPIGNSSTVTGHAYTFLHSTDALALCAVRNPWGGNPNVDGSADGVLDIPDSDIFPPLIDILIMDPGIAPEIEGHRGTIYPYIPPTLNGSAAQMHVAPHLYEEAMKR